jgi:hypothetical protein
LHVGRAWQPCATVQALRSLFHTPEERDGMLHSGMADGVGQSYAALDKLLAAHG